MKNLFGLLFSVFFLAITLVSCDDDDAVTPVEPSDDIVQLAQENGFTSLAAALTKAGLVDDLKSTGPFTVFAPTNAAFDNLLSAIGQTSIDDVPAAVLEQILLYHVIAADVQSADIVDGPVSTLEGSDVNLTTAGGIQVNGVNVINPFDVSASNGVIHTIDAVLVPASVGQFVNSILQRAYFSEKFTTLIEAASKADLVETLLTTPNLTIFAPDNAAFEASGIVPANLDKETLTSVLTYHVVGAKVLSSSIPREAATLNGEKLFFSIVPAGNFINGDVEITAVDIESGTGVIHIIDKVVIPTSKNIVETVIDLTSSDEFTSLVDALQRTADEGTPNQNLITVLSGDGPFTVFAPTNAAFQNLLDSNMDWNSLGDIPLDVLINVLTYHVVPARAFDKDLAGAVNSNNELPTALGQNIMIDLSKLTINVNSNIIGVNTNATNGVIHVIDAVLLPG